MLQALNSFFAGRKRNSGLIAGTRVQVRIVTALMIRDAMGRYGHESLGFFWVIGEPLLLTSGVMALWSLTNQGHGAGVGVVPFALTGYSMLTMWRMIVFKSMHGMRRNANLLFHSNVRFFDILVARALMETIGILSAFLVAYLPLWLLGFLPSIHDPLNMFIGWLMTAWFCFGFGLIIAALTELSDTLERFIHPVMYLTLPITGAFYMVDWMPAKYQEILLMSPLVHGSEMFRSGIFPLDVVTHYDPLYLLSWCIGLTGIGLVLVQYAQKHVQMN